jgi:site-specific recombinase XerD
MSRTTDLKEGKATVKIVYRVNKVLADGSHPFLIRITKNRKQIFRATGLSLHPKYWNPEKEEVRRSYPEPQREKLLTDLRKWEDKYRAAAEALADADEQHEAETVLAKANEGRKQTRRVMLLAYFEELAAARTTAGRLKNANVYRDCANQLRKFIKDAYHLNDVPFDRVNVAFCNELETTLRGSGNGENTLSNRFRTLRAVLNQAIAAGVMKADAYPFARTTAEKHKFKVSQFDVSTTPRAISRDELRRLESLQPTTDQQQLAKNVFLFSFYCGGINFVDMAQLRWHDLTGPNPTAPYESLRYVRQKTKGKFSIKLLAPAVALLSAYHSQTYANPDSYVFPILNPTRHMTAVQIKNRLNKVLGQVNQDLKALGEAAGIGTPLTTYVARHSFATTLKMNGVATSIISQAMGHKSERTTAVYLDSFGAEVVENAYEALL